MPIIIDSNSNNILEFQTIANAVNNVVIQNSVTGAAPAIIPTGTDTNISLALASKGNGQIDLVSHNLTLPLVIYNGTLSGDYPQHFTVFSFANTAEGRVVTFPDISGTVSMADINNNISANNFLSGFTSTITGATTTVLTVASAYIQEFTGTALQTVTMPDVTTLVAGTSYKIINNSTGNVTVQSFGGNTIIVMAANTTIFITCVLITGTTAASWNASYIFDNGSNVLSITGTANQVIASSSTGAVTLRLPQDIATTSAVQFNSVQLNSTSSILDRNGNLILGTTVLANAVNYLSVANNSTGNYPSLISFGSDANVGMLLSTKGTAGISLQGVADGSNAPAGYVGELIESVISSGSAVSLTSSTPINLTSIIITPGDWIVWGNCNFTGSGTNVRDAIAWLSITSATLPDSSLFNRIDVEATDTVYPLAQAFNVPMLNFNVTTSSTIYLEGACTFPSGTVTLCGGIYARRVR